VGVEGAVGQAGVGHHGRDAGAVDPVLLEAPAGRFDDALSRGLLVVLAVSHRQVFTDELMGVIDDIAARLDQTDAEAARTDALTIFGMKIGTLQLARALTDRDLSDQLLARGVQTAMKLLDDRA
jgi:hypothetical protein